MPKSSPSLQPRVRHLQEALRRATAERSAAKADEQRYSTSQNLQSKGNITSWDPLYPGEKVCWRSDYIARHARLNLDWLHLRTTTSGHATEALEAKGLGILDQSRVIAPLEDGSLRIWNIDPESNCYGKSVDSSCSGLLSHDKPRIQAWGLPASKHAASRFLPESIVEGVSVDKHRNKAYVALASSLNEVDLTTFQISAYDRYPENITVVSPAAQDTPLTVGTSKALYIYDSRLKPTSRMQAAEIREQMKTESNLYPMNAHDPDYAPLSQPLPVSIVHGGTDFIHVAGRFPSILNYDRRYFPRVMSTTYSGSRLSCLTVVPSLHGMTTLAAAGDYNGKGSVEIYRLATSSGATERDIVRNRTSTSQSKCLSLSSHGTRIVYSDSDGVLKWIERDGITPVRRCALTSDSTPTDEFPSTFNARDGSPMREIARRILPITNQEDSDICVWTGEKIGVLSFGKKRNIAEEDDDDDDGDGGQDIDLGLDDQERDYARLMRTALKRQADEVRFIGGLGLGRSL